MSYEELKKENERLKAELKVEHELRMKFQGDVDQMFEDMIRLKAELYDYMVM
jgi:hypothetical protein